MESKNLVYGYLTPLLTVLFFIGLIAASFFGWWYSRGNLLDSLIADDIAKLSEVFTLIEQECKILSFEYQQNPINFLNIKKDGFTGSEVGPMNLAYPKKWNGPYLFDNPTIQEKEFMVVHTNKGYFITPGNGVKLANEKIIGKDIILDENADIAGMAQDPDMLMHQGRPLAAKIEMGSVTIRDVVPD